MNSNRLSNSVKLPYKVVQGSFACRQSKAANFSKKIINNLSGQIIKKEMSLSKFGRSLKKILPKNLAVFIRKNKYSDAGAALEYLSRDNNVKMLSINLNTDKKGHISILDMPSISHEIRHLADILFHPKILSREQYMVKAGLEKDKYINFYNDNIYVKELFFDENDKKRILKIIRHQTSKILSDLTLEEKVNVLQWMRYNLILENNAYKKEAKITKKLNNKNIMVYEDELQDQTKYYMFTEKIQLFSDMAEKFIKRIHKKHIAKINQSAME